MSDTKAPSRRSSAELLTESRGGRPYRLNSSLVAKYLEMLRAGCYPVPAAVAIGLDPKTLRTWRRRGAHLSARYGPNDPPWPVGPVPGKRSPWDGWARLFACIADPRSDADLWLKSFAESCAEAEAGARIRVEIGLSKAIGERPDLALKWLERRYPDDWGAPKPSLSAQVSAGPGGASASLVVYVPAEVEP